MRVRVQVRVRWHRADAPLPAEPAVPAAGRRSLPMCHLQPAGDDAASDHRATADHRATNHEAETIHDDDHHGANDDVDDDEPELTVQLPAAY